MNTLLLDFLICLLGLSAGGLIGLAFGSLQQAALRRNEERARSGQLKNGWSLMPGAGARVGYLVITLALIQVICPLLFREGTQWWVSAGVVIGYGFTLYQALRAKLAKQPAR